MKVWRRIPILIPETIKILWLPTGTWWKRYWQAVVILLLVIGLVLAILIPVHCGSEITPAPTALAPTAPAPVPEALAPTTPAPTDQPVPVSITNEEFREFLRIVFPGFAREITRHFYFPTKLSEVPLLLRDQKGELEIGYYWWYKDEEDQREEIVLVYDQGKIMIYKTEPFEKVILVEGVGKLVFP